MTTHPDAHHDTRPLPDLALYRGVVGQEAAVAALRAAAREPVHAYLLVGPEGTGRRVAARAFAASLLCPNGGDGTCDVCRRTLAERHPDLVVVERQGASITVGQAHDITRLAARSPVEGDRKVLLLVDFHLVQQAGPALLKTIEEPPASAVFVILADHVPAELVTIASRAVRIDFGPVPVVALVQALVDEGVAPEVAREVADAAGGNIERARSLAGDPAFAERRAAWRSVPGRLDGTGATVTVLADELLASVEGAAELVRASQEAEVAALAAEARAQGRPAGSGRKELEERHRRELRRLRTDELRAGLTTLAGAYRDRAAASARARVELEALGHLQAAGEALIRNPNERLLLQALLARLSEPQRAV